ncbi:hypothetical protein KKB40_03030, partial [Patescibacteria group bacterium]|nr:hypothetical protein [Patescibacteria group bacterium]
MKQKMLGQPNHEVRKPLIVEQTSINTQDDSQFLSPETIEALRNLHESPAYHRYSELLQKNINSPGYAIIHNLYNKYLGKEAINLQDVVQGIVSKKIGEYGKKQHLDLDQGAVEAIAKASWSIEQQIEKMKKEAEFYDRFIEENEGIFRVGKTGSWTDLKKQMDRRKQMLEYFEQNRIEKIFNTIKEKTQNLNLTEEQIKQLFQTAQQSFEIGVHKEHKRTNRKIAEIRELLGLLEKYEDSEDSLEGITTFIDMAGGAGDLGVAIAEKYSGKNDIKVRIVDVMPVLEGY